MCYNFKVSVVEETLYVNNYYKLMNFEYFRVRKARYPNINIRIIKNGDRWAIKESGVTMLDEVCLGEYTDFTDILEYLQSEGEKIC